MTANGGTVFGIRECRAAVETIGVFRTRGHKRLAQPTMLSDFVCQKRMILKEK
jgi:hypothetical protein